MFFWGFSYYIPFQYYPVTPLRAFLFLLFTDSLGYWLLNNARSAWGSTAVNLNLIQSFASVF